MFIYAPIGMLYEYPDVLPKLIKKGKSQVQIAKVMGEVALRKGQADPSVFTTESLASAGGAIAKLISEMSDLFNLVETENQPTANTEPNAPKLVGEAVQHLPIANYDQLTAREIVGMLADITPAQRARVRAHETANRARKTVLSKLEQLGD
jgi:hypothetical protein